MNHRKGYLRLTLVLSILSFIIGLIIGINYFKAIYSSYHYNYNTSKNSLEHSNYYDRAYNEMFNILNSDSNNDQTQEKINHKDFNIKVSSRLKIPTILDYNVKINLLGNISLIDSIKKKEITIQKILESKINKVIPDSTKKLIAQQYATDMCPIIEVPYPTKELLFFLVLIPLLSFAGIWLLYITIGSTANCVKSN